MRAQTEQFSAQELAMYRAMALFRSLLTPLPCTVEDAAQMSHDDIVEFYRVRAASGCLPRMRRARAPLQTPCCACGCQPDNLHVAMPQSVCQGGVPAAVTVLCSSSAHRSALCGPAQMYVAALMECMRGPVDDMLSPSYQRLRQLIEAHVRLPHVRCIGSAEVGSRAVVHFGAKKLRFASLPCACE